MHQSHCVFVCFWIHICIFSFSIYLFECVTTSLSWLTIMHQSHCVFVCFEFIFVFSFFQFIFVNAWLHPSLGWPWCQPQAHYCCSWDTLSPDCLIIKHIMKLSHNLRWPSDFVERSPKLFDIDPNILSKHTLFCCSLFFLGFCPFFFSSKFANTLTYDAFVANKQIRPCPKFLRAFCVRRKSHNFCSLLIIIYSMDGFRRNFWTLGTFDATPPR